MTTRTRIYHVKHHDLERAAMLVEWVRIHNKQDDQSIAAQRFRRTIAELATTNEGQKINMQPRKGTRR